MFSINDQEEIPAKVYQFEEFEVLLNSTKFNKIIWI
jgi:sRNA-binding regulator protein Hfq